ncbi:spermidine synthase [Aureococcus anophagefferens]|nr:spermidine synthase [Aureococcus anophagefferens]
MSSTKKDKKFYHATAAQAYYMKPSEAATVSLAAPAGSASRGVGERDRPRLGIVVMTKRPLDFEQWLVYHRSVIGTQRDYFVQMDRQAVNVACAVPRARASGVEWLLHVDDDELLHAPGGVGALWAALKGAPKHACDAHVKNVEALAPDRSCAHPFVECTTFVASTSKYSSYTNGKSFGRVGAPGLRAHRPHHFRGDAPPSGSATVDLPPSDILDKLPFPFYRSSLAAVGHLARCAPKDKAAASDAAVKVWTSRKLVDESRVPPKDAIVVTAVRDALRGPRGRQRRATRRPPPCSRRRASKSKTLEAPPPPAPQAA